MFNDFSGRPVAKLKNDVAELQQSVEEIEVGAVDTTARNAASAAAGLANAAQEAVDALAALLPGSRVGSVVLSGANPTPVAFGADAPATLLSANAAPFNLGTDGLSFIATIDGTEDTATFNCAAGTSVSGADPSANITAEVDTKLMVSVDGEAAAEIELTNAGKDDGTKIATELQAKIRALGGAAAAVTVVFGAGIYTITSGTKGTGSSVVITPAASGSITEELKLGVAAGGVEAAGTGGFVNAAAATADEVVAVLNADLGEIVAVAESDKIRITADTATVAENSTIVVGAGTANTVLGFTGAAEISGAQGLGFDTDMATDSYVVIPVVTGASATSLGLSVANKTASQFNLICETAASTATVDLLIIGAAAE